MNAGRPPTPIAVKRAKGDTRQRGVNRHEESLDSAWESKRGRPPMPAALRFRASPIPENEKDEDRHVREQQDAVRKARLAAARQHWTYLAEQLEGEQLLSALDGGMLTSVALCFALMIEAAQEGRDSSFVRLQQRYMQGADRMGLNESARARLPRQKQSDEDPMGKAIAPRRKTA